MLLSSYYQLYPTTISISLFRVVPFHLSFDHMCNLVLLDYVASVVITLAGTAEPYRVAQPEAEVL